MIPGCTSSIDVELDDHSVNLNNANTILVTINQNGTVSEFTGDRVEVEANGYSFTLYLDQADTLRFRFGPATAQVNWTIPDGSGGLYRLATDPFVIQLGQQFYRKVMV